MKIIAISAILVGVIAVGANATLKLAGFSSEAQKSSPTVRLDSP